MMRYFNYSLMLGLALISMSCQSGVTEQAPQTIKIYMTVDWEGRSLNQENIEEMQAFRKKFPHIPMLQLMNPAYFLRGHSNNARLTQLIKSTFLPVDTVGLHVHAWKSLTNHCNVPYQYSHSFADIDENCEVGDCGYTVSLENAYSQNDLIKLISCSNHVLVNNGFNKAVHFRAGGWQLGPKLIAALAADGFVWDSSKIDPDLLTTRWHENSGMVKMLRQLHSNSTHLDQPYPLTAQLMEYPNNAALADYTSAKQIVTLFDKLIEANKNIMVLGFHQETAADFLGRIEKAIPKMEAIAAKRNLHIKWVAQ